MIDIEFGNYHIQKEKESYEFEDEVRTVGDSNIAYKNVDGETVIQNVRVRRDGYVKLFALKLLCSYTEREVLRKICLGRNKTSRRNSATLTISGEGDRNTMVKVVSADSEVYEERNIIEGIDVIKNHPSQYGNNTEDILYEIYVVFVAVR